MTNNKGSQLQMFHHPVVAIVLYLLYTWLLCFTQPCLAKDFLNTGEKIIGNASILVSARQKFALGFFTPSTNGATESYLGIWYYQSEESESTPKTVVWVGNRDNPVVDSTGVFQIRDDGNLVVLDTSGKSYWSTGPEGSSSTNKTVKLMDSGNLVLLDDHFGMMWQSFQHPTDTFLPGMKMDANLTLTSWKDASQPGSGNYTFKMAENRYIILKNENQRYWESERKGDLNSEGKSYIVYLLTNFTPSTNPARNNSRYKSIGNPKPRAVNAYENTRLQMNSTGELQFLTRDGFQDDWYIRWKAPASFCDRYNACGMFSSCNNNNNRQPCKCLPGFNQISEDEGSGCARKSASCGEDTPFLTLVMVKKGNPDKQDNPANEEHCKSLCLNMCPQCQAYSYASPNITRRDTSFSTCWIWTQNLTTIQEEYSYDYERNLSVRVHMSDIAPTAKTCKPCGTNIVPYPLSTGPNCGDPMFLNFSCNHTSGQLSFITPNNTYSVTRIDADSRKFIIQVSSLKDYCHRQVHISTPFNVSNECYGEDEVEVSWQPPLEPTCTESKDCEGWNHISSCKATRDGNRCLCNTNYHWDGVSLNCSRDSVGKSKNTLSLILGITIAGTVLLACTIIFAYVWRRKIARKQGMENIERNRGRFYDSERDVKNLIDVGGLEEKYNEGIEVPYFDFESIQVATDNFSDANMLGRGGYGPVYKGKLQGGQVIAVKRLSSVSSQGLQEFKNEVVLIAKLQHRNLVRLRGYCIKGDEKILLYEYMPNKSLDSFIFDPTQSALLDWQMRFDIILGIARGMLYLHQDSRLRVIHRDLKTSNILLDEEMQPRISDFGLARIVRGKETEANTKRVVGTYGYMSPEYALDGLFSTKSDIFSFGVLMLEIISGKKNTGFYSSEQVPSLLGYAWRLWTENKLLDLMDLSLQETCNANQFIRCAHIGLLCVQDEPGDRPTMSNVVTMLDSEIATLPTPKQSTFFTSRDLSSATSSSKPEASLEFGSGY